MVGRYYHNLPPSGPVEPLTFVAGYGATIIRLDDLGEVEVQFTEPPQADGTAPLCWSALLRMLPVLHLDLLAQRNQLARELDAARAELAHLRAEESRLTAIAEEE